MGDIQQVNIEHTPDMQTPAQVGSTPPAPASSDPVGIDSVPDKFKTETGEIDAQKVLQSYLHLERQQAQAPPAPAETPSTPRQLDENFLGKYEQEYMRNGSLSEQSYNELGQAGVSRYAVDRFISGGQAQAEQFNSAVRSSVGGDSAYNDLVTWARGALSAEEQQAYNAQVQSGNTAQAQFAAKSLYARMLTETQSPTANHLVGKPASAGGPGAPFNSTAEALSAMRDPRYKTDPAYANEVHYRIQISGNDIL